MLTSRGWWFLLIVLAILVLGLASTNPSLSLVGLTLLAWFLAEWLRFVLRLRLARGKLSLVRQVGDERGPADSLWAGLPFSVQVRLINDSRVTLPYLQVTDRVPPLLVPRGGASQGDGQVGRNQPLELRYQAVCPAPSLLIFEGLRLEVLDLQGFFLTSLFIRQRRIFRVLPPLVDARGRRTGLKRHNQLPLLGFHAHRRPGTGSELLDVRDYLPGDPPKTIAWKLSARRDKLMTKEFESEVPLRCTFFVDISSSVRVEGPGRNALARLAEIAASVAQASMARRDLVGMCLCDEHQLRYTRPARGSGHLIKLLNLLADAAGLPPPTADMPLSRLLPLGYGLAQELYPEFLDAAVNAMPFWLPLLSPQPAYTMPQPPRRGRFCWTRPGVWFWGRCRYLYRFLDQNLAARFSLGYHRRYYWRKQLAALLASRHDLGPGGLASLLEDDRLLARHLQRFLNDHQVPLPMTYYDFQGRYCFASVGKIEVLARGLLRAVAMAHDNELFVLLADLLELGDHLSKVLAAIKVALARHHQVMVVCPWPPGIPLPPRSAPQHDRDAGLPSELFGFPPSATVQAMLRRSTILRFHRAFFELRRSLARLGVTLLCARGEDSVRLILERLEHLRTLQRGVSG